MPSAVNPFRTATRTWNSATLLRRGRSLIDSLAALPAYVDAEGDFVLGFGGDEDLPDGYAPDDLIEAA